MSEYPYYENINGTTTLSNEFIKITGQGANKGCMYITSRTGGGFGRWVTEEDLKLQPETSKAELLENGKLHPSPHTRKRKNITTAGVSDVDGAGQLIKITEMLSKYHALLDIVMQRLDDGVSSDGKTTKRNGADGNNQKKKRSSKRNSDAGVESEPEDTDK